jgi:hypothetical protein
MLPSAYAEKLPAPTGKPVLTISGKIGNTNVGDKAVFDLAMLEKLGMKTMETTTPWYTGKVRFDGIPLNKLMDLVGAKGTSARVLALNDYTTIIPIDDFYKFPVIMALKMNGEYMRIRDKGPYLLFTLTTAALNYRTRSIIPDRPGKFQRLL